MKNASFQQYNLSQEIVKALDSLGYASPTEVQSEVIPQVLKNRDTVVQSQTGSGKTASFAIPICEMVKWEENKPQALILTPTRELALQIKEDFINIGRLKRIKAASIYGKQPFHKQKLELKQKTHVVVGTPGRILDHIQKGTFPLEELRFLVIDEADEMLNRGFIEQVESIIESLPNNRNTLTFSATLPEDVESLCYKYMNNPVHIKVKAEMKTVEKIDQVYMEVPQEKKLEVLKDIVTVEMPVSCIIFCRTKDGVNTLFEQLDDDGFPVDKIHGDMIQEDRIDVMNDFKKGVFRYLVATDVAARGIDVEDISHVINYDIPLEQESYVHRIGRTGRMGKKGKAITFVTPYEKKFLEEIEDYIGLNIPTQPLPTKEEVEKAKADFEKDVTKDLKLKKGRSAKLDEEIMKLYFNGGKKKKLRAVDFVGTIANIEGVSAEDIGIISIEEHQSFVEILNGKGLIVLHAMKNKTVKGKQLKVHEARD